MFLKNTNKKLGKTIYSFSLPRSTCVGKSEACDRYCYAKKGTFARKKTIASFEANLDVSKEMLFPEIIIGEIMRKSIKWVRIHPVGDFYDQEYVDKWIKIAKACPQTRFLAFTRNLQIDFSENPENLVIYGSVDYSDRPDLYHHSSKHCLEGGINKVNYSCQKMALMIKQNIGQYFHMQRIEGPYCDFFVCDSKCSRCKACWSGKINVAFPYRNNLNKHTLAKIEQFKKEGRLNEYIEEYL